MMVIKIFAYCQYFYFFFYRVDFTINEDFVPKHFK